MLEYGASCFHEGKRIDKDGEEILAYYKKHNNDSVEMAILCKLLFFAIYVATFRICLAIEI